MKNWKVRIKFVWRDLWIGVYVGQPEGGLLVNGSASVAWWERTVYVIILPMLPICVTRRRYVP